MRMSISGCIGASAGGSCRGRTLCIREDRRSEKSEGIEDLGGQCEAGFGEEARRVVRIWRS